MILAQSYIAKFHNMEKDQILCQHFRKHGVFSAVV